MAYTEVFISESVMDERGNRVQCLGVISYYEGRGAKIAFQIQRGETDDHGVRLEVGISKLGGTEFNYLNVIAGSAYAYCIAKKLWPYLVDQFEDCLKKVSAHPSDGSWDDWLRLMTACLQTNGTATISDVRKAILKCAVFQ
jgi:hypothetical protein